MDVARRSEDDVAASAAVPTVRASLRLEGLASHRGGTVATATGAHLHVDLVYERHLEQPRWSAHVVDWAATGEDWLVVEPVDVWMVHLGARSRPPEVRGRLSLGDRSLEFLERKTGVDVRFDYGAIRRAKRIKGSPVLLVDWRKDGQDRKTAFYFSQPPPLDPLPRSPTIDPRGPLGPFTRATPSKRQVARMNLGYLRSTSATSRQVVQAWAEEVTERAKRAS